MPPQIIPQNNQTSGLLPQSNAPAPIIPQSSAPTPQSSNGSGLDRQALDLTHAIAMQESGGKNGPNYNAVGDNGTSHGAYQWQPGNFEAAAKQFGLDPTDMSPKNQDAVAYAQVKAYKDQGLTPPQIASIWNSGKPNNYIDHSGTTVINGKSIKYDTPAYVNGVKKYYDQISGGNPSSSNAPDPSAVSQNSQTTPNNDSLGSELSGRLKDAGTALESVIGGKATGQSRVSGLIQTAGAVGGAIGDVTNKALELIPGVKALEGWIGKGAAKLAQTPTGQKVVGAIQSFSQAHPELSKDIGAGVNIVTAIPILDGLGAIKDVALDGASQALKSQAEKVVTKDLTQAAGKNVASADIDTLVKNRVIPTITNGVYDTTEASAKLNSLINNETDPAKKLSLINAQSTLQNIDGKAVQLSTFGKGIKYAATAAGELAGEHIGIPLVGGYLGNKAADIAEKSTGNISKGILERSENNIGTTTKTALKKTAKAATAGLIQNH